FEALEDILERLGDARQIGPLVARFELALLAELGFGLDLSQCAATGAVADLAYVSPKSGRAVSRQAGEAWRDKLMQLPAFLAGDDGEPTPAEVSSGFAITGHFLSRHVLEPRGIALPRRAGISSRQFCAADPRAFCLAASLEAEIKVYARPPVCVGPVIIRIGIPVVIGIAVIVRPCESGPVTARADPMSVPPDAIAHKAHIFDGGARCRSAEAVRRDQACRVAGHSNSCAAHDCDRRR